MAYQLSDKELKGIVETIRSNVKKTESTPKQPSEAYKKFQEYKTNGPEKTATIQNRGKTNAQKLDVQKKKEDRIEEKTETNSAEIKKDRTKKQHEDYFKALGAKRKELSGTGTPNIIQNNPYGYNADLAKEIQGMERQERVLRARAEQAEQDYIDAFNKEKFEEDMAIITGLPEEQRLALERYSQSKYMTSDIYDHDIIDEMREKYGQERLDSLEGTLSLQRNEQHAKDIEEKAAAFVEKQGGRGTVANLASVPVAAYSGLMRTSAQLGEAMIGTRGYIGMDPYVGAAGDAFIGGVRGQTSENIAKTLGDGFVGNAANIGYQAVMSYLDNAARVTLGGGSSIIGATLAGTSAFSQTVAEASAKGADFAEAAALGTVSAFIEYGTEKMNLDSLIGIAGGEAGESIIRNIIKNAGVEIAEEEISLIANVFAEAAILQEKGSFNQSVNKYILEGKSPEEARRLASDEIIAEALNTALVTGFSGALGGYTASLYDKNKGTSTLDTTPKTAEELKQQALDKAKAIDEQNQTPAAEPSQTQQEQQIAPVEPAATVAENATTDKTEAVTPEQQKENVRKAIGEAMFAKGAEMAGRDVQQEAQQTQTEAQQPVQTETAPQTQTETLGKQNAPSGDIAQSKTYTNTGVNSADEDIRGAYKQTIEENPQAADYEVKHNKDTMATAQERTQTVEQARVEADYLNNKDPKTWTAEDNVTAELVIKKMMQDGGEDGAQVIADTARQRAKANINAGQVVQSNRIIGTMKVAQNAETAVDSFITSMEKMKEGETTYSKKSGKDFETWKRDIETSVTEIGIAVESVDEGDAGSMRNIIRQIARERKTTAWFGTSDNLTPEANRILNKLDYDTLKKIANTQVAAMADDYRKRSKGEVATTLRKQSMLSSLKTIARNIGGNTVGGVADAVSESGAGRLADMAMSKFTGKKTVGSDVFRAKEYATAAKDAGQFASLCVELNIPIETDVDASFASASGSGSNEKYIGRTFRSTGNPVMRFLYAYQKYMSYALEVTDKVFEGGTNAAVEASLNRLKNSNLTEEDVAALSDFTSQKRTFKNATWEDTDRNGDKVTRGSALSRKAGKLQQATGIFGDIAAPFVSTPMNVAQTGIDYTAGVAKSIGEMISIIRDAKAGKTIPVERQRQAASDFGRGVSGAAMIVLFASAAAIGALKVTNPKDWDEEALAKAEGRSGAQFNWDAWLRGLQGKDGKWQTGDVVSSVDFLEPFNTQMYLGYEMAEFEKAAGDNATWLDKSGAYGKASAKSVLNSLMDSPVMTGLQEISDLIDDIKEAEGNPEDIASAVAAYGGDVASSYIPQVVRQTAQHMDGYYRDTKGDTPAETALNSIKAAIPGLSQTLPKKYSGLGEEQKRGSWFETFVDPTATFRYEENKVTTYLDDLSKRTGDKSIYPSKQAPLRIEVGGQTVELDAQQRETYQRTYGEKANQLYGQMIVNKDFNNLPDAMKTEALKDAEVYARKTAMAAVSEYKDAPKATAQQLVADTIADTVRTAINTQFTEVDTAREYGRSTDEAAAKMEEIYDVFANLTKAARNNIENGSQGDTKKYLEVRQKGVKTDQFLKVTAKIDSLKPEEGFTNVREIQTREAIADMAGLTDNAKDILMKAYMTDYDPTDKNPQKTELKYDYARQVLYLAPSEYIDVYRVSLDGGKKNDKIKEWMAMGYTRAEAMQFYNLFDATGKKKIDVVKWYNSK